MALEHVDVLVVGAGLSGVGAAVHLRRRCPGRSVAVLEARAAMGGTWDLFRYPGVRSDSDMYTLGYAFRPWRGERAIADGASIREYIAATAREFGVDALVRYGHRVVAADWDGAAARWTVTAQHPDGTTTRLTCGFLYGCTGYYRYDAGYTPELAGAEDFTAAGGLLLHPQRWPEGLDVAGRRVVVVGSGATAVTLVPALAAAGAQVVMLQRSPSWVLAVPRRDALAAKLQGRVPPRVADSALRWTNAGRASALYLLSRHRPERVRRLLLDGVRRLLPEGYDVATHFTPRYDPWDQRLCFVPGGDLFRAITAADAEVVTDRIAALTPTGVRTEGGRELAADVVVTATGLTLQPLGGMAVRVDGVPVAPGEAVAWKGMMLAGVPNLAFALGYTNASWTLRVDLVSAYVCRLLNRMAARGEDVVVPEVPDDDVREPLIDLSAGYVRRGAPLMPKQGSRAPWRVHQNWWRDQLTYRFAPAGGRGLRFARAPRPAAPVLEEVS